MIRRHLSSIWQERILYAAIWLSIAVLPVVLELSQYINYSVFNWKPVIRWWTGMVPLIVIFIFHNSFLIPRFLKRGRMKLYVVTVILILAAYGGLQHSILRQSHRYAREQQMPPETDMPRRMPPPPLPLPLLFNSMLAALTIGLNAAISLTFTYNREQEKRKELENKRLQEELKYLKQQISPHFLMNVLNNIHELADENIKEAQDMILELSYLMRYVLYESEKPITSLASETRFISSYVALMKMRYVKDIVKISLDIPDQFSPSIHIPPLLFISFIENAFKHGVSYEQETKINIKLCEMNGKVFFSCTNTIPVKKQADIEGGVGLSNVRRRLELLYGEDYSLHIDINDDIYSVTLIIPGR